MHKIAINEMHSHLKNDFLIVPKIQLFGVHWQITRGIIFDACDKSIDIQGVCDYFNTTFSSLPSYIATDLPHFYKTTIDEKYNRIDLLFNTGLEWVVALSILKMSDQDPALLYKSFDGILNLDYTLTKID